MHRPLSALLLTLICNSAAAIPVTWVASGTIGALDGPWHSFSDIAVCDPFQYAMTFESTTPERFDHSIPTRGEYEGAILAAEVRLAGNVYALPVSWADTLIATFIEPDHQQLWFATYSGDPSTSRPLLRSILGLSRGIPDPAFSNALPLVPPAPGYYTSQLVDFTLHLSKDPGAPPALFARGFVDAVGLESSGDVPEPATGALWLTGLFVLLASRGRRQF
jgi:hypothetical protein